VAIRSDVPSRAAGKGNAGLIWRHHHQNCLKITVSGAYRFRHALTLLRGGTMIFRYGKVAATRRGAINSS